MTTTNTTRLRHISKRLLDGSLDDLQRFIKEFFSFVMSWVGDHERVHSRQDKDYEKLQKKIRHLERDIADLKRKTS